MTKSSKHDPTQGVWAFVSALIQAIDTLTQVFFADVCVALQHFIVTMARNTGDFRDVQPHLKEPGDCFVPQVMEM